MHRLERVALDTNIFDKLHSDNECLTVLRKLIEERQIMVLAPATVIHELKGSPFNGVPSWIKVSEELDSVTVLGYSKIGSSRLGSGEIYTEHKGASKKIKDAVIVDFAVINADIFVSEDKRAVKRLVDMQGDMQGKVQALSYAEFKDRMSQSQKML